jgi:hypothetical protein
MVVQRKPRVVEGAEVNYPAEEINPEDIPF